MSIAEIDPFSCTSDLKEFRKLIHLVTSRLNLGEVNLGNFALASINGICGTETLVAAGHVNTQNLDGRKICWKGGPTRSSSRPNVLEYPPTLRFWMDRWSRDQPQPGSLFQRLRETEKRDPGIEVGRTPSYNHSYTGHTICSLKPGFHIVVSVVSVVRKKFSITPPCPLG